MKCALVVENDWFRKNLYPFLMPPKPVQGIALVSDGLHRIYVVVLVEFYVRACEVRSDNDVFGMLNCWERRRIAIFQASHDISNDCDVSLESTKRLDPGDSVLPIKPDFSTFLISLTKR